MKKEKKTVPRHMKQNCTLEPSICATNGNEDMKQEERKDIISHNVWACIL